MITYNCPRKMNILLAYKYIEYCRRDTPNGTVEKEGRKRMNKKKTHILSLK